MNENFPASTRQLHKYIANQLTEIYDGKEAGNIAKVLLLDLLEWKPLDLIIDQKRELTEREIHMLKKSLGRLKDHEPVQYVCGKAFFFGRPYEVNKHVLIPRPETEELVNLVLEKSLPGLKILDVGTGSGCIAIEIALRAEDASVTAIDISREALRVARKNAENLKAAVNFIEMDVLEAKELSEVYDIVVSNPPYIPVSDRKNMLDNVIKHEPSEALFVNAPDDIIFYRQMASLSEKFLTTNGFVFFEVHEGKAGEVADMLEKNGFIHIEIRKDLQGKDRMIKAQKGSQT